MKKVYTYEELKEIRYQGSRFCHCHKTVDSPCNLGAVEMYEHDGGEYVEGKKERQWLYFTCSRCNYQWALHKVLNSIKRA
jgi:hypothetical protein